ncbi:hypothetical protein [Ferrovum sp.]|jgi:hypothetical protein|uniref:hypothetical protein n=1 Tax=Ferrovum sp. TaxID=2609467 RepID=UPI00261F2F66|nr:hypothetical protein [Ferrovum sp.]
MARPPKLTIISAEKPSVTVDGYTGKPDPTPKQIKLKTLDDVRLEMSRVYRDARQGRIDCQEGSRLIYMLGALGKAITEAQPTIQINSAPMPLDSTLSPEEAYMRMLRQ